MTFEAHINGTKPVIVDFFATWCGPCKQVVPMLDELKRKVGDQITVLKMDVDKNPTHANRYDIQAIPTVIIFKEGRVMWRKTGVPHLPELLQQLNLCLANQ